MKINPFKVNKALEVYKTQKSTQVKQIEKSNAKDNVTISEKAQAFQLAFKAAKESPDVRMDKVEELRAKIDKGEYKVDSGELADKIVEQALLSRKYNRWLYVSKNWVNCRYTWATKWYI